MNSMLRFQPPLVWATIIAALFCVIAVAANPGEPAGAPAPVDGLAVNAPQEGKHGGDAVDAAKANQTAVTVVSGDNAVAALVYDSPSELSLQEVKDQIDYLPIVAENNDRLEPFSVYADGVEQFGRYNIYDAGTLEALAFVEPSGLAPQTWLLQNTKSGYSYIVELSVGEWAANGKSIQGRKFVFGVVMP